MLGLSVLSVTQDVSAETVTGKIEKLTLNVEWSYDSLWFRGNPTLCSDAASGWRARAKISHSEPGYDAGMRVLIAAKLANRDVKLTFETRESTCWVKTISLT